MSEGIRFDRLFDFCVALLASKSNDLRLTLQRFAARCRAAGMRASASKAVGGFQSEKAVAHFGVAASSG